MPSAITRIYSFSDDKNNGIPITATRVDAELNQLVSTMNLCGVAQATAPLVPSNGAMWYDTTNKLLKVYRSNEWVIQGIVHISTSAPSTPQEGDLWWNTTTNVLYGYDGASQKQIYPGVPSGFIGMWSGSIASIPSGWYLCDGTNGTPDLRSRFIVGAGQDGGTHTAGQDSIGSGYYAPGATGGVDTHKLITSEMPSHTHTIHGGSDATGGQTHISQAGSTNSVYQTSDSTGGDGYHETRPPYLALAYIMKS